METHMIFETHAHYDDEAFEADREELLDSMQENGIDRIVNACASLESLKDTEALMEKYPFVYGAFGIHPDDAEKMTEETLEEAIQAGADMIITHHPMIFGGIKKINNHDFTGRKIMRLIRNNISYYAMHTNYDVLGMADLSADYLKLEEREVLSVTEETKDGCEGFGRVGVLPKQMSLRECGEFVKAALSLNDVKIYGDLEQPVHRAAICTGSGKSMISDVLAKGADVYVTGDIDHHTGIDQSKVLRCVH